MKVLIDVRNPIVALWSLTLEEPDFQKNINRLRPLTIMRMGSPQKREIK